MLRFTILISICVCSFTTTKADDANDALRAGLKHLELRENAKAIEAFTRAIEKNPNLVMAIDRRGDAYLKQGQFKEAIADFDTVLSVQPRLAPEHWRRGIALYYARRYEEGVKQFETHKLVNPQDVENAVWHYLCNARVIGNEKARKELIDVTRDSRVPMAEIQKLFAGRLKPEEVISAAEKVDAKTDAGVEARFYGNLYVALWYEAEGDKKKVLEHLKPAVEQYKIGHYMWDVGAVHLRLMNEKK